MLEIDRMVLIILPTAEYIEWLNQQLNEEDDAVTIDMLSEDCTALLIPSMEDPDEVDTYLRQHYLEIFQNELVDWDFPTHIKSPVENFEDFSRFFDISYHSLVMDMVEPPEGGSNAGAERLQ